MLWVLINWVKQVDCLDYKMSQKIKKGHKLSIIVLLLALNCTRTNYWDEIH